MTAWERASELVVAFRQETDDMPGSDDYDQLVIDIASALADAERGVWEQAVNGLKTEVMYEPSDEAYDNEVGKDGDGTSYNQGVQAAITWLKTQATQEEG